jgi:hypothetical protein
VKKFPGPLLNWALATASARTAKMAGKYDLIAAETFWIRVTKCVQDKIALWPPKNCPQCSTQPIFSQVLYVKSNPRLNK